MQPILFHWRGTPVHSYPVLLYLGIVSGVVAGDVAAHAVRIDAFRAYAATIILILPAMVGARLLHVAMHWPLYHANLWRIWNRREGGAAQYGGLSLALPLSVPLVAALHLSLGAFWDVATFTILVAMIFGRVGCLLNGCCAGRQSSAWYSVRLPNHLGVWQRRIPTQCFEAVWAGVLLLGATEVRRRLHFPGALFLVIAAAYATGRLLLESTREVPPGARRFTAQHWISAALILFAAATLAARWTK
jgi:phosphatidylglycerol:prolipoprotein diacylglycerol transferase